MRKLYDEVQLSWIALYVIGLIHQRRRHNFHTFDDMRQTILTVVIYFSLTPCGRG